MNVHFVAKHLRKPLSSKNIYKWFILIQEITIAKLVANVSKNLEVLKDISKVFIKELKTTNVNIVANALVGLEI